MLDSFLTFINQLGLDLHRQSALLAVSGGVDSIVMTDIFHKAGFKAAIVHCNFGLRGEDSVQDESFVKDLGVRYGFPVYVKHFDVKSFAGKHKVSTQMAARELRYTWFEEIRKELTSNWIATAHHANDALETVLLNLARGTGIAGLHGIAAIQAGIIRPMLFASKEQILTYAQENNLLWREDRSNNSLDYKRNIVRKKIIPVLKELNHAIETTFRTTSEKVCAADVLLSNYLDQWTSSVVNNTGDEISISIPILRQSDEPAYRLWHILNKYKFSYTQCVQIVKSLNSVSGKIFYSESYQILKDRNSFILRKRMTNQLTDDQIVAGYEGVYALLNGPLTIKYKNASENICFEKNSSEIWLDGDKLALPFSIRKWKDGDLFYPFGMKGKRKKVSDLLIDLKMNLFQKDEVNVLTDANGEIIWVIGIRADDRWRITDETQKVCVISRT